MLERSLRAWEQVGRASDSMDGEEEEEGMDEGVAYVRTYISLIFCVRGLDVI